MSTVRCDLPPNKAGGDTPLTLGDPPGLIADDRDQGASTRPPPGETERGAADGPVPCDVQIPNDDLTATLLDRLATTSQYIRWRHDDWTKVYDTLSPELVNQHVLGHETLGVYPSADDAARFAVIDIDLHLDDDPTSEQVEPVERYAITTSQQLASSGVQHLLVRGHHLGSFHLWLFTTPIGAARLGRWLKAIVADAGPIHVDTFPSAGGGGNAVRLPGRHHRRSNCWSESWSGSRWEPWPAAFDRLISLPTNPATLFPDPGVPKTERPAGGDTSGRVRPGDVFNLLVPVHDVLAAYGWKRERQDGDRVRFIRPGKNRGVSASVQNGTVWVYTSSGPGLPPSTETRLPYTAFALIAILEFGGDYARAAVELARQGFGTAPQGWPPALANSGNKPAFGQGLTHYVPVPPYHAFPTDVLPSPWDEFVRQGARALRCDEGLVALPLLAVLAGAIGNSRRIFLGAEWFEPAVLWTCVVAESGGRKSPAAELSTNLVKARQKRLVKEFKDRLAEYKRELADHKRRVKENPDDDVDPPTKPTLGRVLASDITIEKLADLLDDNNRGLLIYRDELAGWLGSFTRYKSKGGSDDPQWLSMHRADALIYDRKTGEKTSVFVPNAAVSVCGGIQPGTLTRLMSQSLMDSGLCARILFAMPPRTQKAWSDDMIDPTVKAQVERSLDALYGLSADQDADGNPVPVVVKLTPNARKRLKDFVDKWGYRQYAAEGERAAALAKLEALPGRFALIHHLVMNAANGRDTDPVVIDSLEAGIRLTEWIARDTDRVYTFLGQTTVERELGQLVELVTRLAGRNGGRVTVKMLQRSNNRKYTSRDAAEADLETLVSRGLGRWEEGEKPVCGGRQVRFFLPCTTHDVSDDRGEEGNDTDDGSVPDGRLQPPDDRPSGSKSPSAPTHDPMSGCVESDPSGGRQESETSCVVPPSAYGICGSETDTPTEAYIVCASGTNVVQVPYNAVTTPKGIALATAAITDCGGPVALDTETTGLDPARDQVRLLQLATDTHTFVVDLFALSSPASALAPLFQVLAGVEVVGHNLAAFDLPFLARLGFIPAKLFDTLIAGKVVSAGACHGHGLGDLTKQYLGITLSKAEQKSDWSKPVLTSAQLDYAAADVRHLLPLASALTTTAAKRALLPILELEMRAAIPIIAMAARGIGIDVLAWHPLAAASQADRARLADELDALAPPKGTPTDRRNWNSPAAITKAFAEQGIAIQNVQAVTIAAIDHPLATKVLDFKSAVKRSTTYGDKWVERHVTGGRVYATWKPCGARTGRMSCTDPNLQQIPRDKAYRRCFTASPGHVLVKADYSQIELRIAAKVTNDARMLAAYRDGLDLHVLTAARFLKVKPSLIAKDSRERQMAKPVNFGAIYGLGPPSLRMKAKAEYGKDMTEAEAKAFLDAFFEEYPGVRHWHNRLKRERPAEVRTLAGRRAATGENPWYGRCANYVVQGTGGDGLKRALALLHERRSQCPTALPVLVVHDEIVVEVPEADANTAAAWLRQAMIDGMAPLLEPVPVEVEVSVGRTWAGKE